MLGPEALCKVRRHCRVTAELLHLCLKVHFQTGSQSPTHYEYANFRNAATLQEPQEATLVLGRISNFPLAVP